MPEYFLRPHVFFCCRGNAFVFLDLGHDDYLLVNGNAAAAMRSLLQGPADTLTKESIDALQELLEGGLLTTDRNIGKKIAATEVVLATEPLVDPEALPKLQITLRHVWRFIAACVTAAARLRWRRLEDTVGAIEQRKKRHAPLARADLAAARELTAIFQRLRSLFPRNYLCLFDSLALTEFLARYRVFPTWVFAVKLEPWAAHCWVQEGQFVFNEGVEEAANYTPVMAI